MQRLQAYKFRLRVTPRVAKLFAQFVGCCRYVYNRALALQNERREKQLPRLNYAALCKELTAWRNDPEIPWLKDAPVHALQNALKALDRAYVNFFEGRAAVPAFKKKGRSLDSFRETDPKVFTVDAAKGTVRLPKVGWVRLFNSQMALGAPKNCTVSKRAGKWHVSIQTEREVAEPVHTSPCSTIALDAGVVHLATLSTGEHVAPVNAFRGIAPKLRRLQRSLSRKVKFSKNWRKAKEKVAKLHSKAAARRNDHLHKLTTRLSKNHATIVVEDLKVANMTRSARGTVEKPGRMVRQKAGLNRSILDQGWGEMRRQLEYKAAWAGGKVIAVNPAYSSQTCHCCGLREKANRLSQSRFACLWCGLEMNADVNAAKVLLAVGQTVTACGGASGAGGLEPPA